MMTINRVETSSRGASAQMHTSWCSRHVVQHGLVAGLGMVGLAMVRLCACGARKASALQRESDYDRPTVACPPTPARVRRASPLARCGTSRYNRRMKKNANGLLLD